MAAGSPASSPFFGPPLALRDMAEFRRHSAQLEAFRCKDFSDLEQEINHYLPQTKRVLLFPMPIVTKASKDAARHYVRPPTRTFVGVDDPAEAARLYELGKTVGLDGFLLDLHQRLICHQSMIATVEPGKAGRPRLLAWAPYECAVTLSDPMAEDLADAIVQLMVPVTMTDVQTTFGVRELPRNADGDVPAVGVRLVDPPAKGQWFPPIADDIRALQIGVVLVLSDLLHTACVQSHGQLVVVGEGAKQIAKNLDTGSNTAWILDGEVTAQYLNANPNLAQYLSCIEAVIEHWATLNYQSSEGLAGGTVITGAGVNAWRADAAAESERISTKLEAFENALWPLLISTANASLNAKLPMPTRVAVAYHMPVPVANDAQAMQTFQAAKAEGLDSSVEYVARTEGLSLEDAQKRVDTRAEANKAAPQSSAAYMMQEAQSLALRASMGADDIAEFVASKLGISTEAAMVKILERLERYGRIIKAQRDAGLLPAEGAAVAMGAAGDAPAPGAA